MQEPPIRVTATLRQIVRSDLAQIALPNGKISLGHLSRELSKTSPALRKGARVLVEMTPFDFETARIVQLID